MSPREQGEWSHPCRLTWHGTGRTHTGLVRPSNQDAFAALDQFSLWIAADGMGGHAGGDVASRVAVETLSSWGPTITRPEEVAHSNPPFQEKRARALRAAIQAANEAILQQAFIQPHLTGMGTTLVVLHIASGIPSDFPALAIVAHLGDSRAYLLRGRTMTQLTRDHSWVEDQVQQGLLSPQEALLHPLRHMLTRALGTTTTVEPALSTHPLQPDDSLMLCTDGLTKMLDDGQILEILHSPDHSADAACDALIAEANRRGGQDNTTVLVVRAEPA